MKGFNKTPAKKLLALGGVWLSFFVLVQCVNKYPAIRTISEIKKFKNLAPDVAIPVFIDAVEKANRDVQYASLATLGQVYREQLRLVTTTQAKLTKDLPEKKQQQHKTYLARYQADINLMEEFLIKRYDDPSSDFNHRHHILRALSPGIGTQESVTRFFQQIFAVENEANTPAEKIVSLHYAFKLVNSHYHLQFVHSLKTTENTTTTAAAFLERFQRQFLSQCEDKLSHPYGKVFTAALTCLMNYATWTSQLAYINERENDLKHVKTILTTLKAALAAAKPPSSASNTAADDIDATDDIATPPNTATAAANELEVLPNTILSPRQRSILVDLTLRSLDRLSDHAYLTQLIKKNSL